MSAFVLHCLLDRGKMIGYLADQIENRTVVLRNLPENVTDEQLKELFPEAPNFLLARDKDHKPKG